MAPRAWCCGPSFSLRIALLSALGLLKWVPGVAYNTVCRCRPRIYGVDPSQSPLGLEPTIFPTTLSSLTCCPTPTDCDNGENSRDDLFLLTHDIYTSIHSTPPSFPGVVQSTWALAFVAERLRRETRNLLGSPRAGSNPAECE